MQCIPQYMKSFPWVSLCPSLSLGADRLLAMARPNKEGRKARKKGVFGLSVILFYKSGGHGARTRNPLRGTTFPVLANLPVAPPLLFSCSFFPGEMTTSQPD